MFQKVYYIFLITALVGCEPQLEIPIKVSKNFWYKYENAKETEWSRSDSIYTVSFSLNNFPKEASFKSNGQWIKTVSYLPPRRSMVCVQDFVEGTYEGANIMETIFVETAVSERYIVTIETYPMTEEEADSIQVEDEFEERESEETYESIVLTFDSDCVFLGSSPLKE